MRYLFALVIFSIVVCVPYSAADRYAQFEGNWRLVPEKSLIYPASQWVTSDMSVKKNGTGLVFVEQRSFDEQTRTETHEMSLPPSKEKGVRKKVKWKGKALLLRGDWADKHVVNTLALGDRDTLVRTTKVWQKVDGKRLLVLDEREVFIRK